MIYKIDNIQLLPFNPECLTPYEEANYKGWFNDPIVCKYNSHSRVPFFCGQPGENDITWKIRTITKVSAEVGGNEVMPPSDFYTYVGNVALQGINFLNRSAEVAIIIGVQRGQGTGYKAIKKVIEHGFDQLNLHRIWLGTSVKNEAMVRIAEKVGMQKEGVQRQALWKSGEYHDIVNYGVLRREYETK